MSDGDYTFFATEVDDDFRSRINNQQVSFGKNDLLICTVRSVQRQTSRGLKSDYTIVKVLEHRPGMKQMTLLAPKSEPPKRGSDG